MPLGQEIASGFVGVEGSFTQIANVDGIKGAWRSFATYEGMTASLELEGAANSSLAGYKLGHGQLIYITSSREIYIANRNTGFPPAFVANATNGMTTEEVFDWVFTNSGPSSFTFDKVIWTTSSLALTASYINPLFISESAASYGFGSGDVTNAITGSLVKTASVNLNTITFTKGDDSTFDLIVDTGSAETVDISPLNSFTESIAYASASEYFLKTDAFPSESIFEFRTTGSGFLATGSYSPNGFGTTDNQSFKIDKVYSYTEPITFIVGSGTTTTSSIYLGSISNGSDYVTALSIAINASASHLVTASAVSSTLNLTSSLSGVAGNFIRIQSASNLNSFTSSQEFYLEGGTSLGPEIDRDKIGQILTLDISGALDDPSNEQIVRRMDIQSLGKSLFVDEIKTELFNSLDSLNDPTNRVYSYADFGKLNGFTPGSTSIGVADLLVILGKFGQSIETLANDNEFVNGAEQFILPGGSSFIGKTSSNTPSSAQKSTGSLNQALVESGILTQNGPDIVTGKLIIDQTLNQNASSSDDPARLEIKGSNLVADMGIPTVYFTDLGTGLYDTGTLSFTSASGFNLNNRLTIDQGGLSVSSGDTNLRGDLNVLVSNLTLTNGDIDVNGNITASGNISASGDITTNTISNLSVNISSDNAIQLDAFSTTSYDGAIYDYILKSPTTGSRAGQFMVAHDNGLITFTDTSTRHLTDPIPPSIDAVLQSGNIRVRIVNGNGYTFKALVKKL